MLDGINETSTMTVVEVKKYIKSILYSTKDNILTINDDGTVSLADSKTNQIIPSS